MKRRSAGLVLFWLMLVTPEGGGAARIGDPDIFSSGPNATVRTGWAAVRQ